VLATDDVDALLALKPDCVVYNQIFADSSQHEGRPQNLESLVSGCLHAALAVPYRCTPDIY
jgi:hypothetical protein